MENAIDITLAVVLPLLATVLTTIAIPAAIAWLKANNVIKDEARAKLLQSALENAALTAIARAGGAPIIPAVTSDATGAAIAYVKASVPDTVRQLGLSDSKIADLVVPHIQRQMDRAKP
ncbi:hypothetical protein [Aurantimonas sp. NFXS3]|uniref:hypothetical protein n=1 Tax=Aurantimonas sp. NFXS3 TaxID=2818434 RepID=UPI003B8AA009